MPRKASGMKQVGRKEGAGLRNGDPARFLDIDVPVFAQAIDLLGGEA